MKNSDRIQVDSNGESAKKVQAAFDQETHHLLNGISKRYYHHILEHRLKAGRFLKEGTIEQIPGWPFPYTKDKK